MNNQQKSKAYIDGVNCGERLLCAIAEQFVLICTEYEEDEVGPLMASELNYGRAITFLAQDMGAPFLSILPVFFTCMDNEAPKSIRKYEKKGDVELIKWYLMGFYTHMGDNLKDWCGFLLEHGYAEIAGEEDEIDFDPEQVQQVLFDLERSGE